MIPKIIHYCWLSNDPIPEDLARYMKSWKEKLPDYEFIKWDFNRFEKNTSVWVSEAFDNKKYAFACDFIRLYAVYNYGGIYMDMDIEVLKSFDDLLDSDYFFAKERPNAPWIEAGCFGAEKGNKFLRACLDYYSNRHFIKEDGKFDQKPLPQIMHEILVSKQMSIELKEWKTFTAKSFETGIESPDSTTYTIHHFAGSWKNDEEKKLISEEQRLSKKYGVKLGRNMAQFSICFKKTGLIGCMKLLTDKIKRKIGD